MKGADVGRQCNYFLFQTVRLIEIDGVTSSRRGSVGLIRSAWKQPSPATIAALSVHRLIGGKMMGEESRLVS